MNMKKIRFWNLIAAMCLLPGMSGCNEDLDGDLFGRNFVIYVVDEDGNNLLSPDYEGNLIQKLSAEVVCGNDTLRLKWDDPNNRYLATQVVCGGTGNPIVFGCPIEYYEEGNLEKYWIHSPVLIVGDWEPAKSWETSFKVVFPDYDLEYDVRGVHKYKKNWNDNDATWYVDGEKCHWVNVPGSEYADLKVVLPIKK